MSMAHRGYKYALAAIVLLVAALLWWGIVWLDIPPVYRLARTHNPFLFYQGHVLIALAVLLAWFHRWAIHKLLWLCQKINRWASALMMMGVVIVDTSMHLLSIPHIEGWWLPMFGGSAFITGMGAWLNQWRKKPKDL